MSDYSSDSERENEGLSNPDVVTKYKAAAKVVNEALAAVVAAAKPGAKVVDLCALGDSLLVEGTSKEFKGKDIEKGIAVPTCISVNNCVGHCSPLADSPLALAEGDVVKVDLGAHFDGYIAQAAHTVAVAEGPVTGRAADAIAAAHAAYEAACRLVRAGRRSEEVGPVLQRVVEAYGCHLVEGVLTHEMKRFIIDGAREIVPRPAADQKPTPFETEVGDVYAVDVVVSTGEGKARVLDEKETTVFKRALDTQYQLKIKASREVFSEINRKYPTMLFTARGLQAQRARYGIVECVSHGLIQPYPVLYERQGELVAHFKGTVLLVPNGVDRITGIPLQALESDKKIEDAEVNALLATSLKPKKKKKAAAKAAQPMQE